MDRHGHGDRGPTGGELLEQECPHREQQAVARPSGVDVEQRRVHQPVQQADGVVARCDLGGDVLDGVEVEPPGERGDGAQQRLLGGGQAVVRPADRQPPS